MSFKFRGAGEHRPRSMTLDVVATDGTFSGYASLFGKVDLAKDKVEQGAFSRSLEKRKEGGIRMLYQHNPAEPIGVWCAIHEDHAGLFVEGKISQSSVKGREVLSLLREGAIDGLSIGFRTEKSHRDRRSGVRSIVQADLWEISIVTFPMLPQARVEHVKSLRTEYSHSVPKTRKSERLLSRSAGLLPRRTKSAFGMPEKPFATMRETNDDLHSALARCMTRAANTIHSTQTR